MAESLGEAYYRLTMEKINHSGEEGLVVPPPSLGKINPEIGCLD